MQAGFRCDSSRAELLAALTDGQPGSTIPGAPASTADSPLAGEQIYCNALRSLPAAVYTCDGEGRVTLFNDAAVELWGRTPKLGEDRWCGSWRIFHTDGRPMELGECPMAIALREGRQVRGVEIIVERPDGTRRHVLPHPDPLFDEQGRVIGAVNMLVDITQRKRDESELISANRELRRRNDELAQFIHTVSHDLRSPLVTTTGFIGIIREDLAAGRSDAVEESIQHIERAMSHMGDLIDDLINLGRAGRRELSVEEVNVEQVAAEVARELAPRLSAAGVTLRVQRGMPQALADAARLHLALEHLILNALQHGGRAGLLVNLGAVVIDDEVRVFVQDNGVGIASQFHKKVFDLFQRLDPRGAGTGVGLAIVSRIMELHGGRAWVESMPDHGATFWLAFPREAEGAGGCDDSGGS